MFIPLFEEPIEEPKTVELYGTPHTKIPFKILDRCIVIMGAYKPILPGLREYIYTLNDPVGNVIYTCKFSSTDPEAWAYDTTLENVIRISLS